MSEETPTPDENQMAQRRRSCFFTIIGLWFAILGVILIVMFLVRGKLVTREPDQIFEKASQLVQFTLPDRFVPYSMTSLFGKKVMAFWDQNHVREDGRALAVIAVFTDSDWQDSTPDLLESEFKENAKKRLLENDFRVLNERQVQWEKDGVQHHFLLFEGRQQLDDTLEDATSCYRYLDGPDGPVQVYTLGINRAFSLDEQVKFLKSVAEVKVPTS